MTAKYKILWVISCHSTRDRGEYPDQVEDKEEARRTRRKRIRRRRIRRRTRRTRG